MRPIVYPTRLAPQAPQAQAASDCACEWRAEPHGSSYEGRKNSSSSHRPDVVQPALPRQNVLGQTLQVTGGARKKATGCMAVPPVPARHHRSRVGATVNDACRSVDPGCLRKGWGIMGFLKNNPTQSSRAYPILSDVSGFPGSKIGDTSDSCNIGHGPLKRCGSSGVHPWL